MARKDEAAWHAALRRRNHAGKPAERPAAASLAHQPARVLPGTCSQRDECSPQHGGRYPLVVWQLHELCILLHRPGNTNCYSLFPCYHFELMTAKKKNLPGEACEGVPVNLLDDVADVASGEYSGLGGGCVPRP